MFGFQSIREILILGHRQAFAWIDEWFGMTLADVRVYEGEMQRQTNNKVTDEIITQNPPRNVLTPAAPKGCTSPKTPSAPKTPSTPKTPTTPTSSTAVTPKSWFSWS